MKIVILGAGQVGGSLAENLAGEANDITLVDIDYARLRNLQSKLEIRTVQGLASHPNILRQAGCEDAEMLIAVTGSDEVNLVACQIAHALFNTPTKIARLRASAYLNRQGIFQSGKGFAVDVQICPEQIVTSQIRRLIEYPGTLQVLSFAQGLVQLAAVKAHAGGPLIGRPLAELREHLPHLNTHIAAIYRDNQAITPSATTILQPNDEVFFLAASQDLRPLVQSIRKLERSYKRILIAGGGNIGERLAENLEGEYQVKIIESNPQRCIDLADSLERTIVINGLATDKSLLQEESIADQDIFCALTNDDEVNVMSAMLAKRLGVGKVIALISNPAYADLVQGGEIDIAFSPQQATLGSLLTHVRRGAVQNVHSLRRGAAEALEITVLGDAKTSKVVGRQIQELKLPTGVTLGALVRNNQVLMAHHKLIIETGDQVILFLADKRQVPATEKLFSVGVTFI